MKCSECLSIEISRNAKKSRQSFYRYIKVNSKIPTAEELASVKRGRRPKYIREV